MQLGQVGQSVEARRWAYNVVINLYIEYARFDHLPHVTVIIASCIVLVGAVDIVRRVDVAIRLDECLEIV